MRIIVSVRVCILSLFLGLGMIGAQAQVLDTDKNHNWPRFAGNTVASMGVAFVGKTALKAVVNEERPDAAATALGVERVVSDRHHWYDVAAGAALGYGTAELTWWLSDKFLGRNSNLSVSTTGQTVDVVYNF